MTAVALFSPDDNEKQTKWSRDIFYHEASPQKMCRIKPLKGYLANEEGELVNYLMTSFRYISIVHPSAQSMTIVGKGCKIELFWPIDNTHDEAPKHKDIAPLAL